MDPLSIIVSSIALANAVYFPLKAVYAIRHAKPELMALFNEISDLLIVLRELEAVLKQRTASPAQLPPISGLADVVVNVKAKLEQLMTRLSEWKSDNSIDQIKGERPKRFRRLSIAYQAKKYKEELADLRGRLSSFLAVIGVSTTSRIEIDLKQILLLTEQQGKNTKDIDIPDSIIQEESSEAAEASGDGLPPRSGAQAVEHSDEEQVYDIGTTLAFHHNGSILFDSKRLTGVSAVGIRTASFPRHPCKPWCSCICHSETRIQTPRIFQWIMGSLFIGYSGLPVITRACDQELCHLRAQPMSFVTYFFPSWFLARAISLVLTTVPLAGPLISLKTQRTVPDNADIFKYAKLGYVDKLEALFDKGLASPNDVHYSSGVTALHHAISHRRVNVCEYLLRKNAHPFLEDRTQWSAADQAWDKIPSNYFPKNIEQAFRLMFSETDCVERREFTVIHKTVLGLISGNLEQQLCASTADLNASDSDGRVPVSLAASRGDSVALRALLRHKPDVNIGSLSGETPLHFACCVKDPSCTSLLINAGATIDACTNWKQTPLIFVAAYTRDAKHAEILLDAGADINWKDRDGINALSWTAIANNVPVAELLIRRGANLTNVDNNGDNIATLCIASNRVSILRLLIGRRPVADGSFSPAGLAKNALLVAAEHATLDTIDVLSQLSFDRASTDIICSNHKTWKDILKARADYDTNMEQAFERLIETLQSNTIYRSADEEDDEENELSFEDALEHQNS